MNTHTKIRSLTLCASLLVVGTLGAQAYRYDEAGRLIRAVYPGGGGVAYTYDLADNMTAQMPLDVPAVPTDIQIGGNTSTGITLDWSAVTGASAYVVERRVAGTTDWERLATVTAPSYVDTTVLEGVTYEYRIASVGPDGEGAFSPTVSIEPGAGPALTLVPRIASGTSFSTAFAVVNLTANDADFRLAFYNGSGNPLSLPTTPSTGGASTVTDALTGTVPANGAYFAETVPQGATQAGYAVLEQGGPALSVTSSITQFVPGRDPFQAATPLTAEPDLSRFPFTNQRPFTTVMALTNRLDIEQTTRLIARRPDGVEACTANLMLDAGAHVAFALQDQLACSAASDGILEIDSSEGSVGPISFVFHDFGPFTTNLPTAPGDLDADTRVLPRIATGDTFETVFQISNTGEADSTYRIAFYDTNGAPLSLPMADAAGNNVGTQSVINGVVPGGGLVVARTAAEGATLAGYGVVETGAGAVAVNSTISQLIEGRDPFQASAPLLRPAENARFPYVNQRPYTTVVAVTNMDSTPMEIRLAARAEDGTESCSDTRTLAGGGHDAFVMQERLACSANSRGVLEIQTTGGSIAPLSFIFHDFGPFTTNLGSPIRE